MEYDVVLIHGAWTGPWLWQKFAPHLTRQGHRVHALSVPGVGEEEPFPGSLNRLTARMEEKLGETEGPYIFVGHGEGGIVATELAERLAEQTAGVVFIGGIMLPHGYSFADIRRDLQLFGSNSFWGHLTFFDGRRSSMLPADAAPSLLFHRAEPADAQRAAQLLRPQSEALRDIKPAWTAYRFGKLPRLFVETLGDRAIPLAAQRRMQQLIPGAEAVSLDADHCPMLSMPEELAEAAGSFAARCASSPSAPAAEASALHMEQLS
ncbi:alpha/beta fold hydrolase [Nesterenkonia populi]|uniref:alpha/beta fold hydrolase n=1 Tax=Nesterenkonia populi TaxID=1591087 RepID=UPI0011BD528E|nr:alpha/beta fold hydrolase [Nesterenkonia populi]